MLSPKARTTAPPPPATKLVKNAYGFRVRSFLGPQAFHENVSRLRVAHFTDLHFGRITPEAAQEEAVSLVLAGKPDICVITGDFVCYSQLYLDQLVKVLSKLDVPTFAVLGNHDYWSGSEEVARALRKTNVELLKNENTKISIRGEHIQICGLDDTYTGHGDYDATLKGLDPKYATIALTHVPEDADRFWERGVKMVFAGHTHAGQITLARLNEIAIGKFAGHKYVHGLYGNRATYGALYVGAGVGSGVVPMRIGDRGKREVAFFEFGRDAHVEGEHHTEQPPAKGRKPTPKLLQKRQAYVEKRLLKRELSEAKRALKMVGGRLSKIPPPNGKE